MPGVTDASRCGCGALATIWVSGVGYCLAHLPDTWPMTVTVDARPVVRLVIAYEIQGDAEAAFDALQGLGASTAGASLDDQGLRRFRVAGVERVADGRIMIGLVDVTDHVASLFDALAASMDWGSGFLDVDTIESALILAELAGFEAPAIGDPDVPGIEAWDERACEQQIGKRPAHVTRLVPASGTDVAYIETAPDWVAWNTERGRLLKEWGERRTQQIAAWRAQVAAKARALAVGDSGAA